MREYAPAIVVSILVHAVLFGLIGFTWSSDPVLHRAQKIPPYVKAVVIEKKEQAAKPKPVKKPKPKAKPKPVVKPKPAPKPVPKPTAKPVEKPAEKPKPVDKPKPTFTQPSMAEMLAQEELLLEQQEEAEAAEVEKESGPSDEELAQTASYEQAIRGAINNRWIIPGSLQAQDGLSLDVAIRTLPGGEVIDAKVTKSSGYPVLDDSAVNAIRKASPLPVPSGNGYEQFRSFTMRMVPDFARVE